MAEARTRTGVVLLQLGGPETLEDIEPFLFNLFCDPDIIDFPFARLGRKPLAKLISATRASKVRHHYAEIGGGSPIRRNTEAQARALEELLNAGADDSFGGARLGSSGLQPRVAKRSCRSGLSQQAALAAEGVTFKVVVAMRYWRPFTREAVAELEAAGCDQVVLLPLYPQYSSTTTGSSLNEWERCCRHAPCNVSTHLIREFYRDPGYLDSVVEKIEEALGRFPEPHAAELVFSAHSVPLAVIEKGDPYQRQVEETVTLVMQRGGFPNRHRLCYQSKVGASRWLQPSLRETLRRAAAEGVRDLCVVPIAFVSDHVETLGEIDHEAREMARGLGIRQFEMTAGLNDSPRFIAALAELVKNSLAPAMTRAAEELVAAD
jgi:ferrochelatase